MMLFLSTFFTTVGIMVAMDQFAKMKLATKHRELMRVLDTFRRA